MPAEPEPQSSRFIDPQTWVDLLTVHAMKGDVFSARPLMVIHDGTEKLARALAEPSSTIVVTATHAALFERLHRSFNNPHLLKEAGIAYLEAFHLPDVAMRHFDLASQFSLNDRDIEQLQVAAALAVAREVTEKSGHSGIDEAAPDQPAVDAVLRKTSRISNVAEERTDLRETTGDLGRRQDAVPAPGQRAAAAGGRADQLALAQEALARSDFDAASAALEEARQAGMPGDELQGVFGQLGLAAYDHGNFPAALAAFERVRDLGPEGVEGWFNCALVLQKMGRLEEAFGSYQEALKIAPGNPKTWCNLSSIWFERGNPAESEKAARRCLELKPDYARAWDNLASALGALGRLPEAAEACQQAIRLQPALHSAWFKFGVVKFQLDHLVMASEAFNMALENPAFHPYVLYYFAMIAARRGEIEPALQKLQSARETDPDNELESPTVREIAAAYTKEGNHLGAAGLYTQITKKDPNDFSGWLATGTALHRAGRTDDARDAYLRASGLRPENPIAWHNLGLLASDQQRHEEARGYFQREVELAPDDAKAWYDLGVASQNLGREEEAGNAFDQAEGLVKTLSRRSSDLSAALSIVRRLNLTGRVLKTE